MTTVLKFNQQGKSGFNSLFDNLLNNSFPVMGNELTPRVNISETNDAYVLDVNAPGAQKENFTINLDKKLLTISYQPKEAEANDNVKQIRKEFSLNAFTRTFTVDDKIATENIAAKYENGILNITLPKKEEVKVSPKQISVQ